MRSNPELQWPAGRSPSVVLLVSSKCLIARIANRYRLHYFYRQSFGKLGALDAKFIKNDFSFLGSRPWRTSGVRRV